MFASVIAPTSTVLMRYLHRHSPGAQSRRRHVAQAIPGKRPEPGTGRLPSAPAHTETPARNSQRRPKPIEAPNRRQQLVGVKRAFPEKLAPTRHDGKRIASPRRRRRNRLRGSRLILFLQGDEQAAPDDPRRAHGLVGLLLSGGLRV